MKELWAIYLTFPLWGKILTWIIGIVVVYLLAKAGIFSDFFDDDDSGGSSGGSSFGGGGFSGGGASRGF